MFLKNFKVMKDEGRQRSQHEELHCGIRMGSYDRKWVAVAKQGGRMPSVVPLVVGGMVSVFISVLVTVPGYVRG